MAHVNALATYALNLGFSTPILGATDQNQKLYG